MPHLDFGTFAGQLFWLAICFITLYMIVARNVLPKIGGVIEARGKHIADDLERAENCNNQAEVIEAKYHATLAETAERARNLIDESSKKAKEKLDAKRAELGSKLEDKIKKAEVEIAKIEADSKSAVEEISAQLAKDISVKLAA